MHLYSTVSPIAQRLVQVHAVVEKIAGVNGPLVAGFGDLGSILMCQLPPTMYLMSLDLSNDPV